MKQGFIATLRQLWRDWIDAQAEVEVSKYLDRYHSTLRSKK